MSSAPYLFQEMNDEPKPAKPVRRRRQSACSPGVRAALAGLQQALNSIPDAEWEVRRRRWNELQRDLKKNRIGPQDDEPPRKRSAALDFPEPR
jgi:hypothetical protein